MMRNQFSHYGSMLLCILLAVHAFSQEPEKEDEPTKRNYQLEFSHALLILI